MEPIGTNGLKECCNCGGLWVGALALADTLSDFIYFGELISGNQVHDGVAYAVLLFAIIGAASMMAGTTSTCGLMTSLYLEDIPQIILTTVIEAYRVGTDFSSWRSAAIASYVFSVFALQQKVMKVGHKRGIVLRNNPADENPTIERKFALKFRLATKDPLREQKADCCAVFIVSVVAVVLTLGVAWGAAIIVVYFIV